ncbi:MAG TPA: hypothetical protein VLC10_02345, partial [Patescibacteria group bacterium]|nr:hypothetical protein [Patescibacteria group bacterium]
GDATSDTMTFNAATASIADKLNFGVGTLVVDTTNNRVGMGTSAPQSALHVQTGVSTAMSANLNPAGASSVIVAHQNGPQIDEFVVAGSTAVHRAILKGVRANGTLGAPTTAASGDHTFTVEGAAYDGANVNATAAIDFVIDGTVNTNIVPQRIAFMTSASNEASLAERMTVSPSGFVGVGDTSPAALFTVGNGDPFQIDASGNVATTGAVTIGSGGTSITKHFSVAQAVAGGASVNAQSCATIGGVTVLGVVEGDTVIATPTAVAGGIETLSLSWNAYVSGADSVSIRACNPTGSTETTVAQTWRVDVWKH